MRLKLCELILGVKQFLLYFEFLRDDYTGL